LLLKQAEKALDAVSVSEDPLAVGAELRHEMRCYGAHMRDLGALDALDRRLKELLESSGKVDCWEASIRLHDQMVTQRAIISAMHCAAAHYGSTGAGLVLDPGGSLCLEELGLHALEHRDVEGQPVICTEGFESFPVPARPIPQGETVFENAWKRCRTRILKGAEQG